MRLSIALVLAAVAYLTSNPAVATSLRCDGKLVRPGDYLVEVKLRCGEPLIESVPYARFDGHVDPLTHTVSRTTRTVQQVVYDSGPGSFYRLLEFHHGVLVGIRLGERSP